MNAPTRGQIQALYQVECFTGVHGRPPTYRELARLLRVSDPKNAWRRLHYAEKKGLIDGARRLTAAGLAAVAPLLTG